jgi:hypothetical protein
MAILIRTLFAAAFMAMLAGVPTATAAERMSYAAFTAKHGAQKQVKLAPGGGFFLSSMEAADKTITLWLWRIEGEQAYQARSWTLPPNPNFVLRYHTAVAPDGSYVAISTPSSSTTGKDNLRFHRVADDDRDTFDPSDIGHKSGDISRSCGLIFLDADRLLVCYVGRLPHRMEDPHPTSTLVLVTGFTRGKPKIQNTSISHNGTYNSVGFITQLMTERNGIVGAESQHATFIDFKRGDYLDALLISVQGDKITFPFVGVGEKKLSLVPGMNFGTFIADAVPLSPKGDRLIIKRDGTTTIHSLSGAADIRSALSPDKVTAVSRDGTLVSDQAGGLYLVGKSGLVQVFSGVSSALRNESSALTDNDRAMVVVTSKSVIRRDIAEQRLNAARAYDEGLSMIGAGFAAPGFAHMRRSVDSDPNYWTFDANPTSREIALDVSGGKIKAPLSDVGGFLLHLIQAQSGPGLGGRLGIGRFDTTKGEWGIVGVDKCFTHHPLHAAGVRDGDRILSIAGQPLVGPDAGVKLVKTLQPGSRVQIVTARNGGAPVTTEIPVLKAFDGPGPGHLFANLSYFGLLAAQAGHSGIVMQVETRIRQMVAEYSLCQAAGTNANLLGGLARAMNGGVDAGYDYILAQGGLVQGGVRIGANHAADFAVAAAALYADRAKLAYLMETTPDKLPKPSLSPRAPQAYPDLTGRIVEPAGRVPSAGGSVLAPSSSPTQSAPPPAAISGGGQVLD